VRCLVACLAGEEITGDYALWEVEERFSSRPAPVEPTCRGVVRGTDWQRPELQDRYAGHFLPYIERRFRQSV
jgi:uncharacterized protein